MLGKRLIKSNDAGGGGCINTVDLYNPFPDGGGVALYQLNGDATDVSGNYDGTASNVTYGTGVFGQAAVFNGSNSILTAPRSFSTSSAYSVSGWMEITSSAYSINCFYWQASGTNISGFYFESDGSGGYSINLEHKGETNNAVRYTLPSQPLGFNHYAASFDGSKGTIYINGVAVATGNLDSKTDISSTLYIGGGYPYNNITYYRQVAGLDQVRIFNRALRPYEVEALYTEEYCTPTIVPSEHFNTVTYTGNSSTQSITGVGFQPDFVWIKNRDTAISHALFDVVRGTPLMLRTDLTNEEVDNDNDLQLFTDEGFVVGLNTRVNQSNADMVAWCWKAGGDAVTNTDGTITSQVSANTEAGFSIATFTASSGTTNGRLGHGLNAAPEIVIYKATDATTDWYVFNTIIDGSVDFLKLNTTDAKTDDNAIYAPNETTISNIVFAGDWLAYCFHSVEGFTNFGSYVGTGAAGNTIVTGFEPAFVMIKRTDAAASWYMIDNKRSPENVRDRVLFANLSNAEQQGQGAYYYPMNFLENGFELTQAVSDGYNANGGKYIYMAFAADPTAVEPTLEDSFNTVTYTGNGTLFVDQPRAVTGVGFQPDFTWIKSRTGGAYNHNVFDSVRGAGKLLLPNLTNAEITAAHPVYLDSFDNDGFTVNTLDGGGVNENGQNYVAWNWKGAEIPAINSNGSIPSVVSANPAAGFSIVSWTGNGVSGSTVGHGLAEVPEMIIVKNRTSGSAQWSVYHSAYGATKHTLLNTTDAASTTGDWNNTEPTNSVVTFNNSLRTNASGNNYIAYCFAEVAGFSKFGSYTGNGLPLGPTIDCGFEPAFVMVKAATRAGSWFMSDNKRQISGVSTTYLLADSSGAETPYTWIEYLPNGFQLKNTGGGINLSGETYIYMAFANQF